MNTSIVTQDDRKRKARELVAGSHVQPLNRADRYDVISQADQQITYNVTMAPSVQACTCSDYIYRRTYCKHLHAVQLYKLIRAEITAFLDRRDDITLEKFLATMRKRDPLAGDALKNRCYIAVAETLHDPVGTPDPEPVPTPLRQARVFSVRFWWSGMDAARVFDLNHSVTIETPEGLETKTARHDWQATVEDHIKIREWVEDHGYQIGDAQITDQRGGPRRQWQFEFPVYKTDGVQ